MVSAPRCNALWCAAKPRAEWNVFIQDAMLVAEPEMDRLERGELLQDEERTEAALECWLQGMGRAAAPSAIAEEIQ